jgi:hypothetical protein
MEWIITSIGIIVAITVIGFAILAYALREE